jgi:hypothetical protein
MTRIAPAFSFAVLALITISCAGPATDPPKPRALDGDATPPLAHDSKESDEIEKLRALGYLDTTGIPKLEPGSGITIIDPEAAYVGNSLVVFASPCRVELLSPSGEILRVWSDADSHMWQDAELLDNGDLVVVGSTGTSNASGRTEP